MWKTRKVSTTTTTTINNNNNNNPNYSIIKIGQNTEKSPGNQSRLAVTRTPVKEHKLTLVWKTRKVSTTTTTTINNNNNNNPNYSIIKIGQNTEKSPGNQSRLAVTRTPVKEHKLTLVWKTRKVPTTTTTINNNNNNNPNYSIIKIGQNTEKSPGNQSRLAVARTPLK